MSALLPAVSKATWKLPNFKENISTLRQNFAAGPCDYCSSRPCSLKWMNTCSRWCDDLKPLANIVC